MKEPGQVPLVPGASFFFSDNETMMASIFMGWCRKLQIMYAKR